MSELTANSAAPPKKRNRKPKKKQQPKKPQQPLTTASVSSNISVAHVREHAETMNLTSLKRLDPHVASILHTAKHVVLYHLVQSSWQRLDVEGPCFCVQRDVAPCYQLVVLNRLSMDNFVTAIHEGMNFETQSQYVFFQDGDQRVIGMWFFDTAEMTDSFQFFSSVSMRQPPPVSPIGKLIPSVQALFSTFGGGTGAVEFKQQSAAPVPSKEAPKGLLFLGGTQKPNKNQKQAVANKQRQREDQEMDAFRTRWRQIGQDEELLCLAFARLRSNQLNSMFS